MSNTYELTVTRETGANKCVLTGHLFDVPIHPVTTLDPQMMVDYLDAVFPGLIVKWRLSPPVRAESGNREATGVTPDDVHVSARASFFPVILRNEAV